MHSGKRGRLGASLVNSVVNKESTLLCSVRTKVLSEWERRFKYSNDNEATVVVVQFEVEARVEATETRESHGRPWARVYHCGDSAATDWPRSHG